MRSFWPARAWRGSAASTRSSRSSRKTSFSPPWARERWRSRRARTTSASARSWRGIDDAASHAEVVCERSLLAQLEAGCRAPVAARARASKDSLTVEAAVFSADGSRILRDRSDGAPAEAARIGRELGERLLAAGAAALIGEAQR